MMIHHTLLVRAVLVSFCLWFLAGCAGRSGNHDRPEISHREDRHM